MDDKRDRSVELSRVRKARYQVTNARGGTIELGEGDDEAFTPVELFLTAVAGCTAIDVDYILSKRAEPLRFELEMSGTKVRDDGGNHLTALTLTLDLDFPDSAEGEAARQAAPMALARSHERICTVSRTVQLGEPVHPRLVVPAVAEQAAEPAD